MDPRQLYQLIQMYNDDPRAFNDKEAEVIALLSRELGMHFKRESKPFRKALYELGEMGTLGYLPDEWRPISRGESVYGETGRDKIAGTLGSLLGLVGGGYGAVRGAGALKRGLPVARNRIRQKIRDPYGVSDIGPIGLF